MSPTTPSPSDAEILAQLEAALTLVRLRFGPVVALAPANPQAPVTLSLPVSIRVCSNCQHLRAGECAECQRVPKT